MWRDPIVEEVRAAGEKLAEAAGDDLDRFFETIRRNQQDNRNRLVTRPTRRIESGHAHETPVAAALKSPCRTVGPIMRLETGVRQEQQVVDSWRPKSHDRIAVDPRTAGGKE